MGLRETIQKLGKKGKERKELLKNIDQQIRMQKIAEDRQLSSNERELNQLMNEEREAAIKEELEVLRKRKDEDIKFGHNPLDVKNITSHTQWEVLKEKNVFAKKGNMFAGEATVLKNDRNLMKNNDKLFKGGDLFKI